MGKRNKEVSVGRRRPMIQLSGGQKQGLSAVSRSNINQEEPKEIPKKHEMDDPLAGFLAEINSLDTPNISETNETTTKALPSNEQDLSQHAYNNMLYDPEHFDPSTQGHLLPEPWQACYDESTMCHYYWNITTNEVQWIPPVATIPPPPPLPSIDKTLEEVKETNDKKKLEEDPAIETDLESNTEPPIKEEKGLERKIEENVMTVDKDEDKPTTENVSSKKEKDKELMNQIKERIQRKKEEKSRKEKQEKQKLEEETLAKSRKEKEDILREKLIKKKLEREKEKSENSKNVDNDELNNSNSNSDSFSVDIFASEELKVRERRASESKETKNELKKSSRESTPIKDTKSDKSAEVKSGWRLIDAGYDDDDDDDDDNDEEDDNDEDEDDNQDSNKKDDIEQKKSNKTDHDENVDNYAEMLLEDAITIDDKISPQDSIPPPPIPPAPLPPSMPPPPPEQDDKPPPPPEEEPMETLEPSAYENDENKKNIDDTSKELFEKLDFLGISTKDLRGLVVCYIELETRMKDWKSGALSSAYLLEKINELSEQITKHEESAAPPGWVCNWSRWNNALKKSF